MASDLEDVQPSYMVVPEEKVFLLLQAPKHPGIDIDIFLEPPMQEMETLWKEGICIFDGFTR
jgi:hypothetical protein